MPSDAERSSWIRTTTRNSRAVVLLVSPSMQECPGAERSRSHCQRKTVRNALLAITLTAMGCGSSKFHSVRDVSELKNNERVLVGEVRVEEGDLSQWVPGLYIGSVVVMNDEAATSGGNPWWATTVGTDVEDERFGRSGGVFVTAAPRTRVFMIGVRVYATAVVVGTNRLLQVPVEIPAAGPACAYIGTIVLRPEGEAFFADLRDEFELFKQRQRSAVLRGCKLERLLGHLHLPQDETVHALADREPVRLDLEDRGESYYGVRGRNASEILSAMAQRGPTTTDGVAHGATAWKMVPEVQCARYPDGFRVRSGRVRLELGVVLPQWENAAYGSATLRRQWDRFVERMRAHEDGHRRNALAGAEALRAALDTLEPAVSCEALQQKVRATFERTTQDCAEKDGRYDQETQHGKKQGVVLHP